MKVLVLFVFTLLLLSCSQNKEHSVEEFLFNDGKNDVYIVRGEDKHQLIEKDSLGIIAKKYWVDDKHQKNGKYTEYYPDGRLHRQVNVVNNLKHGEYFEYFQDGTISIHGSYYLDAMDGEFSFYREDGALYILEIYERGKIIVQEFLEKSEQVHLTIFPYIAYTPETPSLNDTFTLTVNFTDLAVKRFNKPVEGYVSHDMIFLESSDIPDILDAPQNFSKIVENILEFRYLMNYCSPNALLYGYTFFVDTISKDTFEMEDFFEIITMNCIDI